MAEKTSPRPFSKKSKLSISLDQQSEALYSLLLLYFQVEVSQTILKLEILANMCIVIIYFPVDEVTSFEINLSFLIKLFSCITKKVTTKI